jgi:hypothetical protein
MPQVVLVLVLVLVLFLILFLGGQCNENALP